MQKFSVKENKINQTTKDTSLMNIMKNNTVTPEKEEGPFGLIPDEVFNPVLSGDGNDDFLYGDDGDEVNIDYDLSICVDENDTTDLPINERLLKKNRVSEKSSGTLKKLFEKCN